MRPASILTFDRLYLVAIGLGLVNSIMAKDHTIAMMAADPSMAKLKVTEAMAQGVVWAMIGFSVMIGLLLWYLIAHRASNIAKWILVVITLLGLMTVPGSLRQLGQGGGLGIMVTLAIEVLRVAAISFLFRADARVWLEGGQRDAQG